MRFIHSTILILMVTICMIPVSLTIDLRELYVHLSQLHLYKWRSHYYETTYNTLFNNPQLYPRSLAVQSALLNMKPIRAVEDGYYILDTNIHQDCVKVLQTNRLAPTYCEDILPAYCDPTRWNLTSSTWYGEEIGICYGEGRCDTSCLPPFPCKPCNLDNIAYYVYRLDMAEPTSFLTEKHNRLQPGTRGFTEVRANQQALLINYFYSVYNPYIMYTQDNKYALITSECLLYTRKTSEIFPHHALQSYKNSDTATKECYLQKKPNVEDCQSLAEDEDLENLLQRLRNDSFLQIIAFNFNPSGIEQLSKSESSPLVHINSTHAIRPDAFQSSDVIADESIHEPVAVCFTRTESYSDPISRSTLRITKVIIQLIIQVITSYVIELEDLLMSIIVVLLHAINSVLLELAKSSISYYVIGISLVYIYLTIKFKSNLLTVIILLLSYFIYIILDSL
ncbi:hypothetical protein [Nephila clavipes virus 3]|uniref:hypothetical protein n=1 Tax=Nephila clavipes virus 3 TaxID=2108200 RepID=UPI000D22AB85|nr:hypothetical protein [Nephila clavipes virus 3]AVK59479.1 hypothetical protein [Nephila clavipes virus 3]